MKYVAVILFSIGASAGVLGAQTFQRGDGLADGDWSAWARSSIAVEYGGWTKIREWEIEGKRLNLREDLGMDLWLTFETGVNWRFWPRHALRGAFTWNLFRGSEVLPEDTWNDGTLLQGGEVVDFGGTFWWRAELLYEYLAWEHEDIARISALGGIIVDALDVSTDAPVSPLSGKLETHESFYRQWMPLPAVGAHIEVAPAPEVLLYAEAYGLWVKDLPTWWHEGGRIVLSQTNLDVVAGASYRAGIVSAGLVYRYRVLRINQQSTEDGNLFTLHGSVIGLEFRLWI